MDAQSPRLLNAPLPSREALAEWLEAQVRELAARRQELFEAFARVPETITAHNAGDLADFIRQVSAHLTATEDQRKETKVPILDAGKMTDGSYKLAASGLDHMKETLCNTLLEYMVRADTKQVRGQLGSVASAGDRLEIKAIDIATIDLRKLRRFLDPDAIEKAVRKAMKERIYDIKGVTLVPTKHITVR